MPDGKRVAVFIVVNVENWDIARAMPRQVLTAPQGASVIPDVPTAEWNGAFLMSARPRLGIDAEDLSGQLGSYFGAPEGEGILVRNVNADSPAEKAGVKAGDVITTLNGERIRTASELREKLSDVEAGKTVKLGVLRNKSNVTLNVELPAAAAPKEKRKISLRTNI